MAPYEAGFGLQLWKSYEDAFEITLSNPGKTVTERISSRLGPYEIHMGGARVLLYYGEPGPFSLAQEIYFAAGEWRGWPVCGERNMGNCPEGGGDRGRPV